MTFKERFRLQKGPERCSALQNGLRVLQDQLDSRGTEPRFPFDQGIPSEPGRSRQT